MAGTTAEWISEQIDKANAFNLNYQDRIKNIWIDVKELGATGNGSTDDSDALQDAIDEIGSFNTILYFSSETAEVGDGTSTDGVTYKISSDLTFPSNVGIIFGEGANLSIDSGVTVTINGKIQTLTKLSECFSGAGTYVYNGENRLDALEDAEESRVSAYSGKKIKVVACGIRNTGSGFQLINDAGHSPIGVASVSNDTDKITLNYDFTALKVLSFIVTPDEIMAKNGIIAGSSVGTSFSNIHTYKNYAVNGYITKSGGDSPTYALNSSISKGISSVSAFDVNTLTITHDKYDLPNFPVGRVTDKDGKTDPYISSFGLDETRVKFKTKTKMVGGQITYNGTVFNITNTKGILSAVWDSASNSLLITFSDTFTNMIPNVSLKTDTNLTAKIYSYGGNILQIRFYDSTDTLATSPSTNMKVVVSASEFGGVDTIPLDGVYLFEKQGFAKMNPNDLNYAGSNFWIYGIFEVA